MTRDETVRLIARIQTQNVMTQDAIAQHIGVSNNTVSRWARGKTRPHRIFIKALQSLEANNERNTTEPKQ